MVYNFKEYTAIFDTPMKRQQEIAISRKIMDLLNKNKYDDLEEFIVKNGNYQDFLNKNNMTTVIKHFGNTLKEEDYIKILENLRQLTKSKKEFEQETIKTTNLDNKQFNTFEGEDKTYFIDNKEGKKTIEEQMKELKPTQEDFQTADQRKNTENMFKELETKKEGLNLYTLNDINYNSLSDEEKLLFQAAQNYQHNIDGTIRIDLKKGVIVDELNNISKIEKINGELVIMTNENGIEKEEKTSSNSFQKTLTPSRNTIYSN